MLELSMKVSTLCHVTEALLAEKSSHLCLIFFSFAYSENPSEVTFRLRVTNHFFIHCKLVS